MRVLRLKCRLKGKHPSAVVFVFTFALTPAQAEININTFFPRVCENGAQDGAQDRRRPLRSRVRKGIPGYLGTGILPTSGLVQNSSPRVIAYLLSGGGRSVEG